MIELLERTKSNKRLDMNVLDLFHPLTGLCRPQTRPWRAGDNASPRSTCSGEACLSGESQCSVSRRSQPHLKAAEESVIAACRSNRVFAVDDRRTSPRHLDLSSARMSLRYRDKVVIVTGGSKGIGRGVVRAFGRKHDAKCARSCRDSVSPLCVFVSGRGRQGGVLCARR